MSKYGPKWKEKYCDEVVSFMGSGHSEEAFAAQIKVNRRTVYLWKKEKPEFGSAVERGEDARRLHIEKIAMAAIHDKSVNVALVIFYLKNWAGFRDDQHIDHTTKGDKMPSPILAHVRSDDGDKKDTRPVEKA
uniref:Putative terminase n=1 Tax=viral metagenome TaxID=1070528 RepID=A0A6H1ZZ66_9ZZZZ